MKLDLDYLNFISKEEMRVLVAVELGMRNHEWVPSHLVEKISKMKRANTFRVLKLLLKNKLVVHTSKRYDGYKLNYKGYDYLAINVLMKRGTLKEVTMKVGVGKESDIYLCKGKDDESLILKLARLGRRSFKTIKKNRDYLGGKTQFNWLYLSRLASTKEFIFMSSLHENGFPTPRPVDSNRHAILMSHLEAFTMCKVTSLKETEKVFHDCMDMIERFAENGLIHSDFNEFNIMIDEDHTVYVIDFPQMVSTEHPDAEFYFQRDVQCIHTLFRRRFRFECERSPELGDIKVKKHLDREVQASGYYKYAKVKKRDMKVLDKMMQDKMKEEEARKQEMESDEESYEEAEDVEEEEIEEGEEEEAESIEEVEEEIKQSVEEEEVKEEKGEEGEEIKGEEPIEENQEEEKEVVEPVEKKEPIGNVQIEVMPESDELDDEDRELTEEEMIEYKRQQKEMKYIKKALRRKFKKKKRFKTNKNKTKQIATLKKDLMY